MAVAIHHASINKPRGSMQADQLKDIVIDALEDVKAVNIQCLDVRDRSNVTDYMIIASGTSRRHVNSVAENVVTKVKEQGVLPLGQEGQDASEWILVDLGDVVVNVMMPDTRLFYDLEKLWTVPDQSQMDKS